MVSHHEQQASKCNGEQQHRVLWPAYNPNLTTLQASTEGLFQQTRLIYKRGCQEHFSPYAGGADLFRDIQPLLPWKTLVWCPALGCSIAVAASSLVATTPISFETHQAVRLYGGNHGSI